MRTISIVAVALTLLAACSGSDAEPTSTSTTAAVTTTGETVTTTATTLPPVPPRRVAVDAAPGVPVDLATAIGAVLSAAADDGNPRPAAPSGLVTHLAGTDLPDAMTVSSVSSGILPGGETVAVAHADGGDLFLAVQEAGSGWRIVGADPAEPGSPPWFGDTPHYVLVIGSDARQGARDPHLYHADSLHVLTARPEAAAGSILGWPRDSYVPTEFGEMKITALMVGRGPAVMAEFFRDHWGLPVEGYIATGFSGFEDLIAVLGRLVIDIPRSLPQQEWFDGFSAGEQALAPVRALDYARTRKGVPGGDLTRSFNQGLVMMAALRMIQMNGIDELPTLLAAVAEHTYTDLSAEQLLQLGASAFVIDPSTIVNRVLPGEVGRAGAASVVFLDPAADDIVADLRDDGLLTAES